MNENVAPLLLTVYYQFGSELSVKGSSISKYVPLEEHTIDPTRFELLLPTTQEELKPETYAGICISILEL